jgi:predicted helicase
MLLGRYISDEADEAARVKKDYPVMVVLGNPPYSVHSANKGEWITNLLHGKDGESDHEVGNYFKVDSQPLGERNSKLINDDYVKFIRFAQWRIERTGYGILAFITNHGYLENPTFRGMRQSLMQSFDDIYLLDLHGSTKKRQQVPGGGRDENVFDIQQGVAIGLFVRRQAVRESAPLATVHHADLWGERGEKYRWLTEHDVSSTQWSAAHPQSPFYLFTPQKTELLPEYEAGWKITDIMPVNSTGVKTHRDDFVVDMDRQALQKRMADFLNPQLSDAEAKERHLSKEDRLQVGTARKRLQAIEWTEHIIRCLYRPFDVRYLLYHDAVVDRGRAEIMRHMLVGQNLGLATTRSVEIGRGYEHLFCSRNVIQHHTVSLKEVNYLFPLYLYPDAPKNGLWGEEELSATPSGRMANLAPRFIADVSAHLGLTWVEDGKGDRQETLGPADVFSYLYAILHAPTYRERYADFLKIDFPRLPLTSDTDLFRNLCALGDELVGLHLLEQPIEPITRYPVPGTNQIEVVRYTEPGQGADEGRVYINTTQYVAGVPPEVWAFHIGGYQVCQKWLKDRKGRTLGFDELNHYQKMIAAIAETIRLMDDIDEAIEEHGGWPIQ